MSIKTYDLLGILQNNAQDSTQYKDVLYNLTTLHPADQANIIEDLLKKQEADVIKKIYRHLNPEFIAYLDFGVEDILEILGFETFVQYLERLELQDVIDILEEFHKKQRDELVAKLSKKLQKRVSESFSYPENSIGRIMRTNFASTPYWVSVEATLNTIKEAYKLPEIEDETYDVIVVNEKNNPIGYISVNDLINLKSDEIIENHFERGIKTIKANETQNELIKLFNQYDFSLIAVVNKFDKLIGIVESDEIAEIVSEVAERRFLLSQGIFSREGDNVLKATFYRSIWVILNLCTASLAGGVVSIFENDFRAITTLAILMPIVASVGGNGGMQALTVIVRGLAVGDIKKGRYFQSIAYELSVAVLSGFLFCLVSFVIAFFWFGKLGLALVFGFAILWALIIGGIAGVCVPLIFGFFRLDPAIGSSIILTAITDISGFFSFLFLAHIFLV
jgi:magnesium transporter